MTRFWETKKAAPDALMSEFSRIYEKSKFRIDVDRFHCSLYYDRAYQGFVDGRSIEELASSLENQRLNENVILRIVSGLAAKLAKQRTVPVLVTDMGDWALQRRAETNRRALLGVLHDAKVFEQQRHSDLFLLITGHGSLTAYSHGTDIRVEAVPPWERFVAVSDGRRMAPRTQYRRQLIDRQELKMLYPDAAKDIENARPAASQDVFDLFGEEDSDRIEVISAWHLPFNKESHDGKVEVAIAGTSLAHGEWDRPRHPFADCRYLLPPDGFFGIGVVESLVSQQAELNRTLRTRQRSLELLSAAFILLEKGSNIVKSHINNKIGHIIEFTGTKPEIVTPSAVNPESFTHGDRVRSMMFQQSGLSELAASSMIPAGIRSGKGLRTYADMTDETFHDVMLRRDQQMLDLCEIILDEMQENAEEFGSYKSRYVGPFGVQEISAKDLLEDRDAMVLQIKTASALSDSFTGRLEDVQELSGAGVQLSPDELESLLRIPDLSESEERRYSMRNLVRQVLEEQILDKGKYWVPEPRWDLSMCLDLVSQVILRAQLGKAPQSRVDLLRKWELECMKLLELATPPPQLSGPALPVPAGMPQDTPLPMPPAEMPASPIAGGDMLAAGMSPGA